MAFFSKSVALALLAYGSTALAADAAGVWQTEPKEPDQVYLHVQIGPCEQNAEQQCGQVVGYFVDASPQESDLVGKWMIEDMQAKSATLWKGGTIWAPDDDKTYSAKMELLSDDVLKVSGCVFLFCRGQEWTRVQ